MPLQASTRRFGGFSASGMYFPLGKRKEAGSSVLASLTTFPGPFLFLFLFQVCGEAAYLYIYIYLYIFFIIKIENPDFTATD